MTSSRESHSLSDQQNCDVYLLFHLESGHNPDESSLKHHTANEQNGKITNNFLKCLNQGETQPLSKQIRIYGLKNQFLGLIGIILFYTDASLSQWVVFRLVHDIPAELAFYLML